MRRGRLVADERLPQGGIIDARAPGRKLSGGRGSDNGLDDHFLGTCLESGFCGGGCRAAQDLASVAGAASPSTQYGGCVGASDRLDAIA
jgi:hypothetical protein